MWFRLGHHLRIPVCELKQRISSTEFLKWIEKLNEEEVRPPTRLEQYLAQIAAEIRLLRHDNSKKKARVKLSDLFLHFRFKASVDKSVTPLTAEELLEKRKEAAEKSKRSWMAALGITSED